LNFDNDFSCRVGHKFPSKPNW